MEGDQADDKPCGDESFYGVIKSYNERRGFGFVVCEETARRFGRDVYLSKEEAALLAKEPAVGLAAEAASTGETSGPPVKEGDYLMFQVQRSTEGFPQAVTARRIQRLRGVVRERAAWNGSTDGVIIVQGAVEQEAAKNQDPSLQRLLGAEVRVRQADCGELWLVPEDEVAFCCVNAEGPQGVEAQLIELLRTSRAGGALLGCFSLQLPRTAEVDERAVSAGAAPVLIVSGPPVVLDGHALADRVVLAGLPRDLGVPELMRLFGKLGATDAVVTHPDGFPGVEHAADNAGFASVSFTGPPDVGRFLARAAHTISEQGATQLAHVGQCRRRDPKCTGSKLPAALPALPTPTLTPPDDSPGSLLVQWSQVSLAAGYSVELRPTGEDNAPWCSVAAATGRLEGEEGELPSGLLGPSCTACRVNSLRSGVPYEARVAYYAACGCGSQKSASSVPCCVGGAGLSPSKFSTPAPIPTATPAPPMPPMVHTTNGGGTPLATAGPEAQRLMQQAPWPAYPEAGQILGAPPVPGFAPPLPDYAALQLQAPLGSNAGAALGLPPPPEWRCVHGHLVPAPAAPEIVPAAESGRSICIQWPMVIHATAYTVELFEEGSASSERFTRAVPESMAEALVELRVGNLQPGAYAACVRCVAPCGCESGPSSWSFLPPTWLPPPPPGAGGWHAEAHQLQYHHHHHHVHPGYLPTADMRQPPQPAYAPLPAATATAPAPPPPPPVAPPAVQQSFPAPAAAALPTAPPAAPAFMPPPPAQQPFSAPPATAAAPAAAPEPSGGEALVLD